MKHLAFFLKNCFSSSNGMVKTDNPVLYGACPSCRRHDRAKVFNSGAELGRVRVLGQEASGQTAKSLLAVGALPRNVIKDVCKL